MVKKRSPIEVIGVRKRLNGKKEATNKAYWRPKKAEWQKEVTNKAYWRPKTVDW
jgi:hypothetical protein